MAAAKLDALRGKYAIAGVAWDETAGDEWRTHYWDVYMPWPDSRWATRHKLSCLKSDCVCWEYACWVNSSGVLLHADCSFDECEATCEAGSWAAGCSEGCYMRELNASEAAARRCGRAQTPLSSFWLLRQYVAPDEEVIRLVRRYWESVGPATAAEEAAPAAATPYLFLALLLVVGVFAIRRPGRRGLHNNNVGLILRLAKPHNNRSFNHGTHFLD
jgi:hypothetical protein